MDHSRIYVLVFVNFGHFFFVFLFSTRQIKNLKQIFLNKKFTAARLSNSVTFSVFKTRSFKTSFYDDNVSFRPKLFFLVVLTGRVKTEI